MKRRMAAAVLAFSIMLTFSACGKIEAGETAALDGVTAKIKTIKTETKKNGSTVFDILVEIQNNSDRNVMSVGYDITVLDKYGNELHTFKFSYLNVETAVQPGETVYDGKGTQAILDGKPRKAVISIRSISDENDIPPVSLPKTGDYLYKCLNCENLENVDSVLPKEIFIRIDQGGYERVADLQDREEIKTAVELFTRIQIANETNEMVTDNYNSVTFTFKDGTTKTVSFNLKNLEVGYHNQYHIYELDNFGDFWSYAQSIVKDEQ